MKMIHLDWVQIIKDIVVEVIVGLMTALIISTFDNNQPTQVQIEQNTEIKIEVVINND